MAILMLSLGIFLGFVLGLLFKSREIIKLKVENVELKTTLQKERQNLDEFRENKKLLEDSFKSLALDVLKTNSQNFAELALQSLKTIEVETRGVLGEKGNEITSKINDLKGVIDKFDKYIKEIEIKRETAYSSLEGMQKNLDKTTSQLLGALKLSKGVGNWGEIQLRRIAEIGGMVEHCDFDIQVYSSTNGERYYADMVVNLPNNKKVIVDSKVSLTAFLKYLDEDEKDKEKLVNEFIKNVKERRDELARKEYFKKYEGSVDFVVMFIPSEAMFSTIINKLPTFVEECSLSGVLPASPITLIAILKSIAYTIRQSEIELEAKKILEKARGIYEGLSSSREHLEKLGQSLTRAVESYNQFIGSVERNVFPKGREIQKLCPNRILNEIEEIKENTRELRSPDWERKGEEE